MKGGKKNNESEVLFESLLQRIDKQYNPAEQQEHALSFIYQRPPDEAASALGEQLAVTFQDLPLESVPSMQKKTLVSLTSPHMNPSVIQGFLTTLWTTSISWTGMDWLPSWILHTDKQCSEDSAYDDDEEEGTNWDALTAMIHCHAKCVRRHLKRSDTNKEEVSHDIAVLFRKLQSSPAQIAMLREFTKVAFFIPETDDDIDSENDDSLISVFPMLSPLVTTTVLSVKQRPQHQTILFLEGLWRDAWNAIPIAIEQGLQAAVLDILEWMTRCLNLYLSTVSCFSRSTDKIGGKEIAYRWLIQLLEMATFLEQSLESESTELQKLSRWLSQVVSGSLIRIFATVPTFRISLQPILLPVQAIIQRLNASKTCRFTLNTTETHKIATMLLSNPIQEDVKELILLLTASISTSTGTSSIVQSMLRGVGSMLVTNSNYSSNCGELIRSLPTRASQKSQYNNMGDSSSSMRCSLLQIVEEEPTEDVKGIIDFLATEGFSLNTRQLSVTQQMGALLLGVGLLDADSGWKDSARTYFRQLLLQYPQLGVALLPILIESVNRASVRGDGASLIEQLDFLCDTIIQDAQCAREVWNLLGVQLMQPDVPTSIRASIIRLFPRICGSNKRLYKRVIVALGNSLVFNNVAPGQQDINNQNEIKLAVAATVADLARDDLIRDVTDVIGWIQDFIEDCGWVRSVSTLDREVSTAKAAIVHYALLCLHYLVVSQELDYNVVMVVLRKRLCDVHSMEEVTKLPPLVLEALALLLGDGESGDDESDSGDEREQQVGIHPQVRQSVTTLIRLGLCETLHPSEFDGDPLSRHVLSKCRENIYASLSRYSLEALNLDDEGISAACSAANNPDAPALPESGTQYSALKQVIEKGIQQLQIDADTMMSKGRFETGQTRQGSESLKALTSKILKFEEDTLGSKLWQKRSKATKRTKSGPSESFDKSSYIEALPSSQTIHQLYNENRSTATALSALLCADSIPISSVTMLSMDIRNESSDALINAMYVQSWLHTSRSLLQQLVASQSSSEGLEHILTTIREWRYTHDNTDNMNMALSALAIYIPVVLGPYGDHSVFTSHICDEVFMAYQDHEFENQDVAKLCLGFVAVCSVAENNFDRVTEVVESLEKSVTAYGGRVSFGACFGLASIAQAFCTVEGGASHGKAVGFIRRIIGFLLRQLLTCIRGNHPALQQLLACVELGSIGPEVIDALTALRKRTLEVVESKRGLTKIICISLGLCVRALAIVNDELLLGMYCLLDCLPWGSGKGFALPSTLRTCFRCGLFEDAEVQKIYSNYARIFQDGLDNGVRGLDDILYAVTATNAKVIPHSTRRFLVGNPRLFDKDGRCISLVCAICSLSSLPCLGHDSDLFTDSPRLLSSTTKGDIVGVSSLIMEALGASDFDLGKYSQIGVLLMGYLASLKTFIDFSDLSIADSSVSHKSKESRISQLPTPHQGTVLEILMPFLSPYVFESRDEVVPHHGNCGLVGCLEVLSLPGHFAIFHEKIVGRDAMIAEVSTKLLVSQLEGRPRAVFDGKEFIDMAIKTIETPSSRLRESISISSSPLILESLDTILLKLPTEKVHDAMERIWQMCLSEIKGSSSWALSFLASIKKFLKHGSAEKSFNIAPKKLRTVQTFLLVSTFDGLRNTTWTTPTLSAERTIVDLYAHCLAELPISSLIEVEFFTQTDHDGFVGEALRYRCIMTLVRLDYFESVTRASSEIQAAMSWFSRQLVSSLDGTFPNSLLSVCCSIMETTEVEKSDQRRSLLFMLLDNLMLVGDQASMMGLQMLGAIVGQWTRGRGSDGDLSLACLCIRPKCSWQVMSPRAALKLLELLVRDMPYNLASFAKKERITSAVSNRLHRIHSRWIENDVTESSLFCLRRAIALCRNEESESDVFDQMGTSMLLSLKE